MKKQKKYTYATARIKGGSVRSRKFKSRKGFRGRGY